MKKVLLLATSCFFILSSTVFAGSVATYDASSGLVNIPAVTVGQAAYQVQMQNTESLNFTVTQATPVEVVDTLALYNLNPGNSWTYRGHEVDYYGTGLLNRNTTVTVSGTDSVNGKSCYSFSETNLALDDKTSHLCYDDNDIFLKFANDSNLYKIHDRYVYVGQESSWTYPNVENMEVKSSVKRGFVSTQEYQGEALIIQNDYIDSPDSTEYSFRWSWSETIYLVNGIGLVRVANNDDDGNWVHHSRKLLSTNF